LRGPDDVRYEKLMYDSQIEVAPDPPPGGATGGLQHGASADGELR